MATPGFLVQTTLCASLMFGAAAALAAPGETSASALAEAAAPRAERVEMDASPELRASVANAHPGSRAELAGVNYRWWMPLGQANVSVGVGTLGHVAQPFGGAHPDASGSLRGAVPTVTVGVRYPTSERSSLYADASGASRFRSNGGDAYFTKLGVEWKSAPSRLQMMRGGLGFQLDNGGKMSLRLRGGKVGVYMRSDF